MPKPPHQDLRAYRHHRAKVVAILRAYEEHPNPTERHKAIRKKLSEVAILMLREEVGTPGDTTP